jgi:initiation factor 1A
MVKNTKGGSGHKSQARKHVVSNKQSNKLRLSEDEGEIYAEVTSLLGNGMCHVIDQNEVTRLCIIRGKFRGRGKRDNTLNRGKWVLVGIREFETVKGDNKLPKCDLLEVYNDHDKDKLRKQAKLDGKVFMDNKEEPEDVTNELEFTDAKEEDYMKIMEEHLNSKTENKITFTDDNGDDEDVDIDDI